MPYRVGVRWQELALYLPFVLVLSITLLEGGFRRQLAAGHPAIAWSGVLLLLFVLGTFIGILFKKVVFSEDEIQYHFFWIYRRYRYNDLQSIQPVNKYNLNARFIFKNGEIFKVALGWDDAEYLLEILKERSPSVLENLALLRNALTPRRQANQS
jgi:hypothetical protein